MSETPITDACLTGIEPDNRDGRIAAALDTARRLEQRATQAEDDYAVAQQAREYLRKQAAELEQRIARLEEGLREIRDFPLTDKGTDAMYLQVAAERALLEEGK